MTERKPLELTWYTDDDLPLPPRPVDLNHTFGHGPNCTGWGCYPRDKRLADAELAAEFEASRCDALVAKANKSMTYWAVLGDTWPNTYRAAAYRTMTLLRFATRPHYDEGES